MFTDQQAEPGIRTGADSSSPLISVVMPVHNGLPYLNESIESILAQTLEDFEFIILDDGSSDATGLALSEWQKRDRRIRVFTSDRNLGLAASSNYVVEKAVCPIIARMDADDVAHPDRLKRQWEILRDRENVQLVGTLWEGIDPRGVRVRPRDRWRLVRRSSFAPFPHGSTMFRRGAFDQIGGYRQACDFWEDLDFFLRMATTGRVIVIPDALYRYRFHKNGSRKADEIEKVEKAVTLMHRCLSERRAGRDYEHILRDADAQKNSVGKVHPGTFTSIGSARLWSGNSPDVFDSLLRRGALAWNRPTALALFWSAWGELSPSTLRMTLRGFIRARDIVAGLKLEDGRPHEWRFE